MKYTCDNCGHTAEEYKLLPAEDLGMRLTPGGLYTDRECPKCYSLCFPEGSVDRLNAATSVHAPKLLEAMRNPNGITVAELKRHIADWPETNAMGEPTEVWISDSDSFSSPCTLVIPLNVRLMSDGTETSDLIFDSNKSATYASRGGNQ